VVSFGLGIFLIFGILFFRPEATKSAFFRSMAALVFLIFGFSPQPIAFWLRETAPLWFSGLWLGFLLQAVSGQSIPNPTLAKRGLLGGFAILMGLGLVFSYLEVSSRLLWVLPYAFAFSFYYYLVFDFEFTEKRILKQELKELQRENWSLVEALTDQEVKSHKILLQNDHLLSSLSHEFLSIWNKFTKLQKNKQELDGELDSVAKGFQSFQKNLGKIAKLSKFEARNQEIAFRLVDLSDLLLETQRELQNQFESKKIRWNCLGLDKGVALADPILLKSAFYQLFENASKFTPIGGGVDWSLKEEKEEWVFRLEDSGMGIPKEWKKEFLKESHRFVRLGTNQEIGPGIGLPLALEIARLHRGRLIWSGGSKFAFSIPNHPYVLLYMDSVPWRKYYGYMDILLSMPLHLVELKNLEDAHLLLRNFSPDAIFFRAGKNENKGFEFFQKLYQNPDWVHITSILSLSANEPNQKENLSRKAEKCGVDHLILGRGITSPLISILQEDIKAKSLL